MFSATANLRAGCRASDQIVDTVGTMTTANTIAGNREILSIIRFHGLDMATRTPWRVTASQRQV